MPPATCSGGDDAPRRCAEKTALCSSLSYNGFWFGVTFQRVENYIRFLPNDIELMFPDHILTAELLFGAILHIIETELQIRV
jgi:hypothetical protein